MSDINKPLIDKNSASESQMRPKAEKLHYLYNASFFSKLFFSWIGVLIDFGSKNMIIQENLEDLKMSDRAQNVYENWVAIWNNYKNTDKVAPLKNSIIKTFYKQFIVGMIFDFLQITFLFLTSVMVFYMCKYLVQDHRSAGKGIMFIAILVFIRFMKSFCDAHCNYRFLILGADISNSLIIGMVSKSMNFSMLCNKKFKMGELANLLQIDCNKLSLWPKMFSNIIFYLYLIIASIIFMSLLVQAAFLSGLAVTIVVAIFNIWASRYTSAYQKQIMIETDRRMRQTNEIFNNIKFIKVNAWEQFFFDRIEQKRAQQLSWIRKKFLVQSVLTFSMWLAPKMILVATFGTFVGIGGTLSAPIAFTIMCLFGYLQFTLQFLPNSMSIVLDSNNAIKRIQRFLLAQQINKSFIHHDKYNTEDREAISIENGNFFWDRDDVEDGVVDQTCHLSDINVSINKGQFVAIVGDIGSGKSSFLYSLLGQMKCPDNQARPKVKINGTMSLVTQKPWIVNDTVRNNIIFGKDFNRKKYEQILNFASLKRDMELFTHGDKTMIGQKGATLSGGQKARISFARSLYSQTDILLLDDLLSAVDVHVGKFIFKETLRNYCRGKTILLVTHALYYLKHVDKIIILEGGKIVEQGSFDKLKNSSRFKQIYALLKQKDEDPKKKKSISVDLLDDLNKQEINQQPEQVPQLKQISRETRSTSNLSHIQQKANKAEADKVIADPVVNQLMIAEQTVVGQVPFSIYKLYMDFNGGICFAIAVFGSKFGWLFANVGFNIWLTLWTNDSFNKSNEYYIRWYAIIGVFYGLFAFFRALAFALGNVRMSAHMHNSMLSNLLFSSLNEFFDRVPIGRILNRLSKDLNAVDTNFPSTGGNTTVFMFFFLGNCLVVVYCSSVWVLIPIMIYVICCYFLKNIYMKPQRQLVRLQNNSKSPIISCFTQILNGLATIRAYNKQSSFLLKNCAKINQNKKPQSARKATQVWFTLRLTVLSFIVNIGALSVVLFQTMSNPSRACLLLNMACLFDQVTFYYVTNLGYFENELISFQRCESFMHLKPQPGYVQYLKSRQIIKSKIKQRKQQGKSKFLGLWPERGQIKFIDYYVKYRPNLDPVLRGLSVTFTAGEKIGVVGRTGSGKSTIMMSLLRILESYGGFIMIDNKDIAKMSLDDLRSAITIILQDPCLIAGTLRENLDPLEQYSDDELNHALDVCALRQIMAERKGLLTDITQNGENLSVGERQLISIARAILKPSKIVLIDEATANIDIKTEGIIYKAMNTAFKKSTVITIAHRLNTVINSDKILVLQGGQLKQYDHPQKLLKNPQSFFAQLYNQSLKENKM